jgi:branched-subunit amino acid aminotransferase/4-amino-4-deoxychorismate lyase
MLPGVTAALLRTAMDEAGVPQRREAVASHDVPAFAAAFALNSSVPGRPIAAVDGHWLIGHPRAAAELKGLWETVVPEPLA